MGRARTRDRGARGRRRRRRRRSSGFLKDVGGRVSASVFGEGGGRVSAIVVRARVLAENKRGARESEAWRVCDRGGGGWGRHSFLFARARVTPEGTRWARERAFRRPPSIGRVCQQGCRTTEEFECSPSIRPCSRARRAPRTRQHDDVGSAHARHPNACVRMRGAPERGRERERDTSSPGDDHPRRER